VASFLLLFSSLSLLTIFSLSMAESSQPVISKMGPNNSSAKSSANGPPAKKSQFGLEQPELVFYAPSDNFPYRLKGEPLILNILHNTDWSKTVLGPAKRWPGILVDAIRLALVSRFAMCIWWGPDFIQVSVEKKAPLDIRH
jgi:hypothetical protein